MMRNQDVKEWPFGGVSFYKQKDLNITICESLKNVKKCLSKTDKSVILYSDVQNLWNRIESFFTLNRGEKSPG